MWTDLFPFPPPRFSPLPTVHLSELSEKRTLGMQVRTWLLYECLNRPFCVGRSGGEGERGACDIHLVCFWWLVSVLFNSFHFLLPGNPMSRLAGRWCAFVHFMHLYNTTLCRNGWMHVLFDFTHFLGPGRWLSCPRIFYQPRSSLIVSLMSGFNQIPKVAFAFALRPHTLTLPIHTSVLY